MTIYISIKILKTRNVFFFLEISRLRFISSLWFLISPGWSTVKTTWR